jgi:multicomponent Na+:H+ antiporter subunit D
MSLTFFIALPILLCFLIPVYKNILYFISILMHTALLFFLFYFSRQLPIKEFISFDSPLSITFVLNNTNFILLTLFTVISLLITLFSSTKEINKERFISSTLLLTGIFGLLLSIDIFNMYIFFEIASISSYILSSLNKDKQAYGAAIRYMIIGAVASIFLLLGIILIYLNIGTLNLYTIGEHFHTIPTEIRFIILISIFIGFGIKSEIFPLNFWVADIYQGSSSLSASFFSGMVSTTYIFTLFSIFRFFEIEEKFVWALMSIGMLSFIAAELSALKSNHLKRLFAFSTMGQLGILFLAFASNNEILLAGAFYLIIIHSLAKVSLFLSLDILEKHFKRLSLDIFQKFESLFLLIVFSVGFLSILGIPPFGGFIAKLTILEGLSMIKAYSFIGLILIISIVEAVYFFRLLSFNMRKEDPKTLQISFLQKIVLTAISLALLYLGVFPDTFMHICQEGADSFLRNFHV